MFDKSIVFTAKGFSNIFCLQQKLKICIDISGDGEDKRRQKRSGEKSLLAPFMANRKKLIIIFSIFWKFFWGKLGKFLRKKVGLKLSKKSSSYKLYCYTDIKHSEKITVLHLYYCLFNSGHFSQQRIKIVLFLLFVSFSFQLSLCDGSEDGTVEMGFGNSFVEIVLLKELTDGYCEVII